MPVTLRSRRAFTLVELLMVIVMLGIVMAALMKVVVGQQRFYRGAAEMIQTQTNVRDAVSVLQSSLRGLSPSQGDILDMDATSIDFYEPIGTSIVCDTVPGQTSVIIPPDQLATENGLTSWVRLPAAGDRVLFYDLWKTDASSDDRWQPSQLAAAPVPGATCPTTTGFTTTTAEAAKGYIVQLTAALPTGPDTRIVRGSSIRISRRARFSLYQAGNGQWYLGYQQCPGGACDPIQPVSGPYLPANANGGPSGLTFTYYDNTGTVTATASAVARIDVVTRSATPNDVLIPGFKAGRHVDSLSTSIALRN